MSRFHYRLGRVTRWLKWLLGDDISNRGERVHINVSSGFPHYESLDMYQKSHYRRYEFACSLMQSEMLVGDFACGTGYGSVMLSKVAAHVYGVDVDSRVIQKITQRYLEIDNITFLCRDITKLSGLPGLDAIVSFETIEHLTEEQIEEAFRRFSSLLRPQGMLVVSTPYKQLKTPQSSRHHKTFEIDAEKLALWGAKAQLNVVEVFHQSYADHYVHSAAAERISPDFQITLLTKHQNSTIAQENG